MKNKYSCISFTINILLVLAGTAQFWGTSLLGEAMIFGATVLLHFSVLSYVILILVLSILSFFTLVLSFKNKENIFAKILNIILLVLGVAFNIFYIYFLLTMELGY